MQHFDRSRPAGRPGTREFYQRVRWRYYQVPGRVRLFGYVAVLVAVWIITMIAGLPLATVWYTGLVLGLFAGIMRSPRAVVTALVAYGWLFLSLRFFTLAYGQDSLLPAALAVLSLPVALVAHRLAEFPPWQTTLLALVPAGLAALALAAVAPTASVLVAYVVAAAVLGYRLFQARRLATEAEQSPALVRPAPRDAPSRPSPPISVEEALAELENMIGLEPVKEQVRSIAAAIEAARLRAEAGYPAGKPLRHFVFFGPPGTGKTTVARILAKVFFAFDLIETPYVVEAQRADLVGEYLGATAIKTNELVDRALGGLLFIDEAYSLVNAGDGQSDRFGNEAVQTLLKRAEDDRHQLVIILAGYERQMEDFLASNPGLASRFATRVRFPSYTVAELLQLTESLAAARGERLDPHVRPELWRLFSDIHRRGLVDELGNGRFARSLVESAAQARDARVVGAGGTPSPEELVTITAGDMRLAFAELTGRYRGSTPPPTVEAALAELDRLVGLEPVKRQVHAIAAQLRVAKMREEQGLPARPPMRHFVFIGPPGTGKTTVARVLGRIFAALGLLARADVVEAQRADLVGDHLGATAIKTNRLIDSALDGVLFIDEAYALAGEGYAGGDAFGSEAVQTLLKRAEDDRPRLVIVLAGYARQMDRFLASNPGLASRFNTRVQFPSYGQDELLRIAGLIVAEAGDTFDPGARAHLERVFAGVCERRLIDELGNGRFARSLVERASAHRDVRIAASGIAATPAQLTAITSDDVRAATDELLGGVL